MPEVSGHEFLEAHAVSQPRKKEYEVGDDQNRYITVTLEAIERKELFDELNRLPDGFIDLMLSGADEDVESLDDVEDPEDIDLDVSGSELLSQIDGTTIDVFETLFAMAAEHKDLTSLDMEDVSERLGFEVLFEAGGEVINISLENPNEIKRFREAGSDKNS